MSCQKCLSQTTPTLQAAGVPPQLAGIAFSRENNSPARCPQCGQFVPQTGQHSCPVWPDSFQPLVAQTGSIGRTQDMISFTVDPNSGVYARAHLAGTQPSFELRCQVRYDNPDTSPEFTHATWLWNQSLRPSTIVGVTRTPVLGGYVAIISQDVEMGADGIKGFLFIQPIEADPAQWHTINVTIAEKSAMVEIQQGGHSQRITADAPQPFSPLFPEFGLDNELTPGQFRPVTQAESMHIKDVTV